MKHRQILVQTVEFVLIGLIIRLLRDKEDQDSLEGTADVVCHDFQHVFVIQPFVGFPYFLNLARGACAEYFAKRLFVCAQDAAARFVDKLCIELRLVLQNKHIEA